MFFSLSPGNKTFKMREIMTFIKKTTHEVSFHVSKEKIRIQGLSEKKDSICEFVFTETWFDEYHYTLAEESAVFTVRSRDLSNVFICLNEYNELRFSLCQRIDTLSYDEEIESLQISFLEQEDIVKDFHLTPVNKDFQFLDLSRRTDNNLSFQMSTKEFHDLINELSHFGEYVRIKTAPQTNNDVLLELEVFESSSFSKSISVKYFIHKHNVFNIKNNTEDSDPISNTYNIKLIKDILSVYTISDIIEITLFDNYPLKVKYLFDMEDVNMCMENIVQFFVIPFIECDSDSDCESESEQEY